MALRGPQACVVWVPLSRGPGRRSPQLPWERWRRQRRSAVQASARGGGMGARDGGGTHPASSLPGQRACGLCVVLSLRVWGSA